MLVYVSDSIKSDFSLSLMKLGWSNGFCSLRAEKDKRIWEQTSLILSIFEESEAKDKMSFIF